MRPSKLSPVALLIVVFAFVCLSPSQVLGAAALVKGSGVRILSEPSATSKPLTEVEEGEKLDLLETWYRIRLSSGKEGWISASDLVIPAPGPKCVALLITQSGEVTPEDLTEMMRSKLAQHFTEDVEWLNREAFKEMLADQHLSPEAAEKYPEGLVGLAEGLDGMLRCDVRRLGDKARIECRYTDLRVKGFEKVQSTVGSRDKLEDLADEVVAGLLTELADVLIPTSVTASTVQGGGPTDLAKPAASLLKNMVLVPAWEGVFRDAEGKEQRVTTKAFYIDKFEVTNKAFHAFDPTYTYPEGEDDYPAHGVSWDQAQAYARWTGKRLPTEMEWEKACTTLDGRLYPWGNGYEDGRANVDSTGPKSVGSYEMGKSPYGVYDMIGNVWEWTSSAPAPGLRTRVLRGGAWSSFVPTEDKSLRYFAFPDDADESFGFRCVIDVDMLPTEPQKEPETQ